MTARFRKADATLYPLFDSNDEVRPGFINVYDEYDDGRMTHRFASNALKTRAEADKLLRNLRRSPSRLRAVYRIRVIPK